MAAASMHRLRRTTEGLEPCASCPTTASKEEECHAILQRSTTTPSAPLLHIVCTTDLTVAEEARGPSRISLCVGPLLRNGAASGAVDKERRARTGVAAEHRYPPYIPAIPATNSTDTTTRSQGRVCPPATTMCSLHDPRRNVSHPGRQRPRRPGGRRGPHSELHGPGSPHGQLFIGTVYSQTATAQTRQQSSRAALILSRAELKKEDESTRRDPSIERRTHDAAGAGRTIEQGALSNILAGTTCSFHDECPIVVV
ncbi:hypothetical protein C8R43DRAFT_242035 [Mycena crocata]|nr:hypothetical protein C8R43DRAFT_242035 [Mycena crocata]